MMGSNEASVTVLLSRGRFGRSEAVALVLAALAVGAGAAAWVGADADRAPLAAAALPTTLPSSASTFEVPLRADLRIDLPSGDAVQALNRFASRSLDRQLLEARAALVKGMADGGQEAGEWRPTLVEGSTVAMPGARCAVAPATPDRGQLAGQPDAFAGPGRRKRPSRRPVPAAKTL